MSKDKMLGEQIAKIVRSTWSDDYGKFINASEAAKVIVDLFRQEVEKMENPFNNAPLSANLFRWGGFEQCRAAILEVLE